MLCRNCFNELEENIEICKFCGKKKKKFRFKDFMKLYCMRYGGQMNLFLFAELINKSHFTVLLWHYFNIEPSISTKLKIADSLDIPCDYILGKVNFTTDDIINTPRRLELYNLIEKHQNEQRSK